MEKTTHSLGYPGRVRALSPASQPMPSPQQRFTSRTGNPIATASSGLCDLPRESRLSAQTPGPPSKTIKQDMEQNCINAGRLFEGKGGIHCLYMLNDSIVRWLSCTSYVHDQLSLSACIERSPPRKLVHAQIGFKQGVSFVENTYIKLIL